MEEIKKWHAEKRGRLVCRALRAHGMNAVYAPDRTAALREALSLIEAGDTIGVGGSVTLNEIGLTEILLEGVVDGKTFTFYDQYREGLSRDEALALRHKSLQADLFFSGTNAITIDGDLVNMDGFGNRVAALAFGPARVVVIAGVNKIVQDVACGIQRIKTRAAPLNCRRLKRITPCHETGQCGEKECNSEGRICNVFSVVKRQPGGNSISVIIVGEDLGF